MHARTDEALSCARVSMLLPAGPTPEHSYPLLSGIMLRIPFFDTINNDSR